MIVVSEDRPRFCCPKNTDPGRQLRSDDSAATRLNLSGDRLLDEAISRRSLRRAGICRQQRLQLPFGDRDHAAVFRPCGRGYRDPLELHEV